MGGYDHLKGMDDHRVESSEIPSLDIGELRRRLTLARTEEEDLSYLRRLLHGRVDILRAELDARRGGRGTVRSLESLREALSEVGRGDSRGGRSRISPTVGLLEGTRQAERLVAEDHLARLPELASEEIEAIIERLMTEEQEVSAERRGLHLAIDALESELARRYKEGLAPPV